jgi:hypothetical protein
MNQTFHCIRTTEIETKLVLVNGKNMGFRFRKSIKILPGLKINLTHKGISSASIGKPGASLHPNQRWYSRHRPILFQAPTL